MIACLSRGSAVAMMVLTLSAVTQTAFGQIGRYNPLFDQCCCPPVAMAPAIAVAPSPTIQAIPETVYQEVPVTAYRTVAKTIEQPVLKTVYEDQEVTAYRQVMEPRTVEVPSVTYQTVVENQPMTINRSYWQTVYQPVQKLTPCAYDSRPTFMGWLNRTSYSMRMAFTPNQIPRRQFVPNVITYEQPVQRTVAVPTTRQVTYHVAKLVPYQTTQKVAKTIVVNEPRTVTALEPYTTMRTVAVGTRTKLALYDPLTGTRTALEPNSTTRTAEAEQTIQQRAEGNTRSSAIKQQSWETEQSQQPTSTPQPTRQQPDLQSPQSGALDPFDGMQLNDARRIRRPVPTAVEVGWRARSPKSTDGQPAAVAVAR